MGNLEVSSLGPDMNDSEYIRSRHWDVFYAGLILDVKYQHGNGSELDELIRAFEIYKDYTKDYGDRSRESNIALASYTIAIRRDDNLINKMDLITHLDHMLHDEMMGRLGSGFISNVEDYIKFKWNVINDVLRGLNMLKNNEPWFLLTNENKRFMFDYLERIKHPPKGYFWNRYATNM